MYYIYSRTSLLRDECLLINFIHELQTMWYISYPMDYPLTIIIITMPSWTVKWTMMTGDRCKHESRGVWSWPITQGTPGPTKRNTSNVNFLFLFSNDFGSLNVGDRAKKSSLILYFPLLEQKRGWRPKTYHQGKYDNMQENKTWLREAMTIS